MTRKIFLFTLRQRIISKGWKTATALIAALCLLLPPAIMLLCDQSDDSETKRIAISDVYVADQTGSDAFHFATLNFYAAAMQQDAYSRISYHDCTSREEAMGMAGDSDQTSLALILETIDGNFSADVVLPDDSPLSMDDAEGYRDFLEQAMPLVVLYKSGISISDLASMNGISYEYSYYTGDGGEEALVSGDGATSSQNLDATVKDVLSFVLPFVNIMLLYFLILFYGQGTANCVVMEKASKLMDTFLLSVRPESMVVGKVLAQAFCCILQVSIWVVSLIGGFALGIHLVEALNPATTLPIIAMFDSLGLLAGIFTPANILFFILFLAAGLLLYLALASIGGAVAGKQEDLNMTNVLFTMVLVISFLATLGFSGNMEQLSSASILDWIPFTSILIVPSHLLLGALSLWEAIGSLAVAVITALLIMVIAGRIYKAMALYKGNIPNAKQVVSMIFPKR